MGADINAHNGRALFVAVKNRADRATRMLVALGALTDTEACREWKAADQEYYSRLKSQMSTTPKAPVAATEPTLPSITHKKRLGSDPVKDMSP
jgi:hypothetical protein